jgi:hypothetical protein
LGYFSPTKLRRAGSTPAGAPKHDRGERSSAYRVPVPCQIGRGSPGIAGSHGKLADIRRGHRLAGQRSWPSTVLAVWESGVRVPSAPPQQAGRSHRNGANEGGARRRPRPGLVGRHRAAVAVSRSGCRGRFGAYHAIMVACITVAVLLPLLFRIRRPCDRIASFRRLVLR